MLTGKKVLITGASGTVARPAAEMLGRDNEVWCIGRFGDPQARAELEAQGMKTHRWDLGIDTLDGLPTDFTHVLHSAVLKGTDDLQVQIERNSYATAQLMLHCRDAEAFMFVSTSAVYKPMPAEHRYKETDAMGGDTPWMQSYPTQKTGCEAIVRGLAMALGLPSIIARSSVTYGPYGYGGLPSRFFELMLAGRPVPMPEGRENWCNPMHTDDAARQVPLLWQAAAVPAPVVNWGGDDVVSQRQIMEYISQITGVPARFEPDRLNRVSHAYDTSFRKSLIGSCLTPWREGVRRTIEARFPGAVKPELA